MASARKNSGCPSSRWPRGHGGRRPGERPTATRRPRCTRCQSSSAGGAARPRAARAGSAPRKISARSTSAAPMIMPSAIRKMILRNGIARLQPADRHEGRLQRPAEQAADHGRRRRCARPPPCRRRRWRPTTPTRRQQRQRGPPRGRWRARPRRRRPAGAIERRSSAGSVSARRMLATASPEGKARRRRSTSTGVYSMPTPTPNMPTQVKYSTSCQAGGCGRPIQTMACTSTPMPLMLATEAAAVWM